MNFLIVFTAQYVFLISIGIFLAYAGYLWLNQRKTFISLLLLSIVSFPLSFVTAKVLAHFIYDPRPFVVSHVKPLFAHAADNGFPSDHMLLTMAIASVVFVYNKKLGILLTVIAVCIGAARVLANVHHIEDIVGSAVIAIAATFIATLLYLLLKSKIVAKQK
ncbi:MAG: phosphatase PAP2 family protein [Patescibacteria group bacterium]|nr:phosphatase PAP2 family protein [Patescibacteria group bacterium]